MTLLSSVNAVRRHARQGSDLTAIATDDIEHQTYVQLLNDAADEHFNSYRWDYLERHDGYAFFPGTFIATTGASIVPLISQVSLKVGASGITAADARRFSTNVRTKIRITNDSKFAETEFILTAIGQDLTFVSDISQPWPGDTIVITASFELYTHEFILPDTVRQVFAVRDQEGQSDLSFVDRNSEMGNLLIRPLASSTDRPELASVGGSYTTTALTAGNVGTEGMGLMIWPPPSADVMLQYDYNFRHANLITATDTWTRVPREHIALVEWMAFRNALDSNVEDDVQRAQRIDQKIARWKARLIKSDTNTPNQRFIPPEIGRRGGSSRHPNSRFGTTVVPNP